MIHYSLPEGKFYYTSRYITEKDNTIQNNLVVHLQNSQWQRSHNDWTERPEASKENFGLDGRSSFKEMYSLKEAPPVLKFALILLLVEN